MNTSASVRRTGCFDSRLAAWIVGLLLVLATTAHAQAPQAVPPLSGRLIDSAGALTPAQQAAVEAKLAALEAETGSQVVILLVETTAPEDITSFAHRVADAWKIGRRTVGDGVLIVSAQRDRRVRIEVAKALEGAIPDLAASRIIEQAIVPSFRQGDYAGGLTQAIDQIAARIRGEPLPPVERPGRQQAGPMDGGFDLGTLAIFFLVGVPVVGGMLVALMGRPVGSLVTAGSVGGAAWLLGGGVLIAAAAAVIALLMVGVIGIGTGGGRRSMRRGHAAGIPIIWGGGGGWGGGGSGGFSSGGGGDFGGGGASGSW